MPSSLVEKSLIEKIWADHVIAPVGDDFFVARVDRVLLHERGGGVALRELTRRGLPVRRPAAVFATLDHVVDTHPGRSGADRVPGGAEFVATLRDETRAHRIRLFDLDHPHQGIVHVITPELAIAFPGSTVACNDSHTCTLGGIGVLGWGIGSSDVAHALATQTLIVKRPRTMRITLEGRLSPWISAKDVVLAMASRLGVRVAKGYSVELAGSIVHRFSVEARLTLCNMAVELAATTAVIAPDDATFEYLRRGPFAPQGAAWDVAVSYGRRLSSDPEAAYEHEVALDFEDLAPQVTWGTSPEHAIGVDRVVPETAIERALCYMALSPGQRIEGVPISAAFIGSCTNGRLEDLREAARVLRGRKVARGVRALCVPGSATVKRLAEAEGLREVFLEAGFEWREPGCSFCFNAGGESFGPTDRVVSTTNRNFEHRQGPSTRTHLASPATVAASAVAGCIADVRKVACE